MAIDYDAIAAAGGFGKGRPASLQRDDRRKTRQTVDERESDKVKVRSKGQCEVLTLVGRRIVRCSRRALHVHHMLGGIGVRARGISALAIHKQHTCLDCHSDIGGKKLQHSGSYPPMWNDTYRRVK